MLDRWLARAVTTRATVSVSQPFVTLPSQSPNPTKQVVLQTPAAHVPPAPGVQSSAPHTLPRQRWPVGQSTSVTQSTQTHARRVDCIAARKR